MRACANIFVFNCSVQFHFLGSTVYIFSLVAMISFVFIFVVWFGRVA